MASGLHVFDFVLERERALVLPDRSRSSEAESGSAADPARPTDRLVRLDDAGRRLVDRHLRLLMTHQRHQGRDAA